MSDKLIKVFVMGGAVVEVKNVPDGYELKVIDKDVVSSEEWDKESEKI